MGELGKSIIFVGVLLIIAGIFIILMAKMPGAGKLPGDIFIKNDNFSFYFPVTTCILLSILLSLIMHFTGKK